MRRALWIAALTVLLVAVSAAPGRADSSVGDDLRRLAWDDLEAYTTSPLRWKRDDVVRPLLGAGILGVTALIDPATRSVLADAGGRPADHLANLVREFGNPVGVGGALVAATYVGGWLTGKDDLRETGLQTAQAGVYSLLVTAGLKWAMGRDRPDTGEGRASFHPFGGSLRGDRSAFPSGHTTFAFATATVVAERYEHAGWVTYPVAVLVGWSRVHDDRHWLSDVVAGALIGAATGRWVIERNHEPTAVSLAPWLPEPGSLGLQVTQKF